ncbi:MFS transporter [Schinkia sp. CFF1]
MKKSKIHYAWIIVFVTFLSFLAVQGGRLAFGAFMEPWENDLSMNRATTSLISTLSFVIYGISQPFIGRLVDRFGARIIISVSTLIVGISFLFMTFITQPWQLFVLYAFVSIGVGGASNVAGTVLVMKWFRQKRGLALGILEAGFGFGQMLIVPGSLLLIHYMNWRITNLLLALFLLVVVFPVVLLLLRNQPSEKGMLPLGGAMEEPSISSNEKVDQVHFSVRDVLRKKQFWYLILPFTVCGFTTTGLMDTHLIPYANSCGFSTTVISATVSILAAFNVIGILLSGVIVDYWSSRKLLVFLYFTRAIAILLLLTAHNPALLLAFSVLFGLVDFATVAPTQLLATQLFKQYSIGFIVGCLSLGHQVGSALGSYLPGLFFSMTGYYDLALYLSIIILVAATFLNLLLPEPEKMKAKNEKTVELQG